MALDLVGNLTLVLSVVNLFLLVLGLPLVRGINTPKNLARHGYVTIIALIVQTVLIFLVMVPSFINNMDEILALPPLLSMNTWSHVIIGIFAEAAGFALVGLWLVYSRSQMRCLTAKKYMTPTLVVWVITIITGALIHLLQFF